MNQRHELRPFTASVGFGKAPLSVSPVLGSQAARVEGRIAVSANHKPFSRNRHHDELQRT